MNKRTKALMIPQGVKEAVYKRDGGCCVYCGSPSGEPNAHFISRSQGGLGISRNILTLCPNCHRKYDATHNRKEMREFFRKYLKSKYREWDEEALVFRREW